LGVVVVDSWVVVVVVIVVRDGLVWRGVVHDVFVVVGGWVVVVLNIVVILCVWVHVIIGLLHNVLARERVLVVRVISGRCQLVVDEVSVPLRSESLGVVVVIVVIIVAGVLAELGVVLVVVVGVVVDSFRRVVDFAIEGVDDGTCVVNVVVVVDEWLLDFASDDVVIFVAGNDVVLNAHRNVVIQIVVVVNRHVVVLRIG
jgi:hypothetical protein